MTCPQCGQENPEGARFCFNCGTELRKSGTREERKVVSVLFADLVGFTSRAEQMDPEDVRAILEPYHARLRQELERRGGTVEKFIGDAVMALFGAPTSHEDDPERAVRAALAIRDWIREEGDLQVRVAVTTGETLVALDARPTEGQGMASGDVVNTAARLQSSAPVNGILVDETTYRATQQPISYESRDSVEAKGKSEPIPVWEVIDARSRFGVDVAQVTGAPLVGREREVTLLRQTLERVRQEQSPQLVTLVGVPGIGKSRLVAELFETLESDPELITWRQGRCLPYGDGVTFWALGEMVKAHAGILESDSDADATEKLSATVPSSEDAWVIPHLRPLVGVTEEGELRGAGQPEAFAAWRRFFESIAERGPLVLVFEDLHWADETLLDFIDHLVDWAVAVPMLIVCTARPELLSRRNGWGGGKPNAATISLSPLSDDETAELVHALLERSVIAADVQSDLIERAGGNPLYAEEFVRMVGEIGSPAGLPESVQGIIAARLDALPVEEKVLLQDAAVSGKVFWLGTVERIGAVDPSAAEEALHSLGRKEFVRREARSSVADQAQYVFRHSLVRDVAYSQIPRAARAQKHLAAAEWTESLGRPDDHAELIAHHYLSALEFSSAAGEELPGVADRARVALRTAGARNLALFSLRSAASLYESALELWPADDPERPYVLIEYGRSRAESEIAGEDVLDEASRALEQRDPTAAAEAEVLQADVYWRRGNSVESKTHQDRAAKLLADEEASTSALRVINLLARFRMLAENSEEARALAERALVMSRELGNRDQEARALNTLGSAMSQAGDVRGQELIEEAIEIGREVGTTELLRSLNNLAHQYQWHRGFDGMRPVVIELLSASRRFGFADWMRWAQDKEVTLRYHVGEWAEMKALVDHLIGSIAPGATHYLAGSWYLMRSRVEHASGSRSAAIESARVGLELSREAGDPQMIGPLLAWNTRLGIEDLFDELLALFGEAGTVLGPPTVIPDAAAAGLALGREAELAETLNATRGAAAWHEAALATISGDHARAAEVYAGLSAFPPEADARVRLAQALAEEGQPAEAAAELQRALDFWRSVDATAYVREGEALLAEAS
jgi:predicted ATPase/class 3 adenylate cyclase